MTDLAPRDLALHPPPEAHLLDQVDVPVIVTDAAGTVTYWNRGAEILYGWSWEEALGRGVQDLVVEERDAESALAALDLLRSGQPWEGEFPVRRKDGTRIFTGLRLSPVLGDAGQVIGTVGLATD